MSRLSVIIPTRNRAHMLRDTIDSARAGGADAEIVVIDDASTDDTAALCARLPRITYLRQTTRGGTAAARNRGIAAAAGEFVTFLDDDDLRLPDTFAAQIALLDAAPAAAFCYGRVLIGDSRFGLPTGQIAPDAVQRGDIYWSLLERNFVPACSVVARKAVVQELGGFDERLRTMEDYDLWVRLAERHAVAACDDPVAIYRKRGLSSGQKTSDRVAHGRNRQALIDRLSDGARARTDPARRRVALGRHRHAVYLSLIHDALDANADARRDVARAYLSQARRHATVPVKAWITAAMLRAADQGHVRR